MNSVYGWSAVEPERQKLLGTRRRQLHKTPDATLAACGMAGGTSHTVMLLGTPSGVAVANAAHREEAEAAAAGVLDDMARRRGGKYVVRVADRPTPRRTSKYRFESIHPLEGLPDRDRAQALLTRLADDPGVAAVLEVRVGVGGGLHHGCAACMPRASWWHDELWCLLGPAHP